MGCSSPLESGTCLISHKAGSPKTNGRADSFLRRGRSLYACEFSRQLAYLQYFLKRSLTRPQCRPARKLSMYLARAGPSLW